jgi:diacylglycerol kinase (ATP)
MAHGSSQTARTLVIANHVAAKARHRWPRVRALLNQNHIEFDLHETNHAGDATTKTREALHAGYHLIAVLGGDGTLSEAAQGFFEQRDASAEVPNPINPDASLAVLPAGTGDDFARSLRGKRAPLEEWTQTLISHLKGSGSITSRKIDVIYGRSDHYKHSFICLNASTLGIGGETGARVAAQGQWMRRLSGKMRFLLAAAGAVAAWRERRVVVTVDDSPLEAHMNLVAIANNPYAGAGMKLSPNARIDDGKLDVVLASGFSRANVIRELPRLHTGGYVENPKVRIKQGTYARVETFSENDALPIEVDGNVRGKTPADYRIMPAALQFIG